MPAPCWNLPMAGWKRQRNRCRVSRNLKRKRMERKPRKKNQQQKAKSLRLSRCRKPKRKLPRRLNLRQNPCPPKMFPAMISRLKKCRRRRKNQSKFLAGISASNGKNQPCPTEQETHAADGRDCAEPKHVGDRQQIKRAGEKENADEKTPPCDG